MATSKVGTMDKPTGPSGILSSTRKGPKSSGKAGHGSSKGITCSPYKKAVAGRKMSRY